MNKPSITDPSHSTKTQQTVIRASFLHFFEDPAKTDLPSASYQYIPDGLMVIEAGMIRALNAYDPTEASQYESIEDYQGYLVVPGLIDTHVHYPQTSVIAAHGEQLLSWLEKYTFPAELAFEDKQHAQAMADIFLRQLFQHGTTTALVFGTVHPQSVDALFEEASKYNMRLIAGKVMMDRHAPEGLLDTPESGYQDSKALIEKWHHHGRLHYAITPRFAPTSSPEQLQKAGQLKAEYPDVYVHTHLSENQQEIEWVEALYPEQEGYFDVYRHYGLAGDKSVFAHCLHLSEQEWDAFAESNSVAAFCPTSNLFLGSGLFKLREAQQRDIRVGLGTDVGGGTSFSQLRTLSEAYKIMQLQGNNLSIYEGLYLATLGSAKALSLESYIGNFEIGKEADFVVLDWAATALQQLRQQAASDLESQLFALMMLGDDRNIFATYVSGELVGGQRLAK